MYRSMFNKIMESIDMVKKSTTIETDTSQIKSPKGHLSKAEAIRPNTDISPIRRSYTASDVIRTLVLSAKLVTRRVTAIERVFPDIISSAMMAMKQVRRAMRTGDRPEDPVIVVFIVGPDPMQLFNAMLILQSSHQQMVKMFPNAGNALTACNNS